MTTIFTANPSFLSKITADQADASIYEPWDHSSAQCFMVGEDGNLYYSLYPFHTGANPNNEAIGCANTGNVILLDSIRLSLDGAISGSQEYTMIPCAGTKYFWVLGVEATTRVSWFYSGALYKIVNDTTVQVVGNIPQFETRSPFNPTGLFDGGLFADGDVFSIQMHKDNSAVQIVSHLSTYGGSAGSHPVGIMTIPITEGVVTLTGWFLYPFLTDNFFNYAADTSNYQALTLVPDNSPLGYHYLLTIRKLDYEYMLANPGDSTSYALFTEPGVYMWRPDTGAVTNVTSIFGLTDFGTHLDGSSSSDGRDDYVGCSTFFFNDDQYVCFNRSYSLEADLNTAGHGTYVHTSIFTWDGEGASSVYDAKSYLFDTVTDTGGTVGTGYPPTFVQVGLIGDGLWYLWGNQPLPDIAAYVVGSLIHLDPVITGNYHAYIGEFRNPDYLDWYTVGGADFTSELFTSYYLSSENSLFMEAPWVISYLDNTTEYVGDNTDIQVVDELLNPVWVEPSLFLTPQWEWTDSQSNHRSGPTLDVYQLRTKSTVSDKRTRVRGRGRALTLHWASNTRKPFNLLGWSVTFDGNASY